MSNIVPVYPSGVFSWVDRVDRVSIDFANDINSVASDLISVEQTLGTNPQNETSPPNGGLPVNYATVSNRISDAMTNNLLPVCILRASPFTVNNSSAGQVTNFNSIYDPFSMFNGTDITIKQNGWYMFSCHQTWSWWNDGFSHTYLTTNGDNVEEALIDWAFSGNLGHDPDDLPRWVRNSGRRPRIAHLFWQGRCGPGERISIVAENGTSNASLQVTYTAFKIAMLKTLPVSLASTIQ